MVKKFPDWAASAEATTTSGVKMPPWGSRNFSEVVVKPTWPDPSEKSSPGCNGRCSVVPVKVRSLANILPVMEEKRKIKFEAEACPSEVSARNARASVLGNSEALSLQAVSIDS